MGAQRGLPSIRNGMQARAVRELSGRSRGDIARATGLSRRKIAAIEQGRRALSANEACALAAALGVGHDVGWGAQPEYDIDPPKRPPFDTGDRAPRRGGDELAEHAVVERGAQDLHEPVVLGGRAHRDAHPDVREGTQHHARPLGVGAKRRRLLLER